MATESPVRLVGSGTKRWPADKEPIIFGSSSNTTGLQGVELLMKEHKFNGNRKESVPNRCGSAPPSMEGSFEAIHNVLGQKNANIENHLGSIPNAIERLESEEQLRADPAYLAYYLSNVNLNPRLPPPLFSRENRHLAHRIGRPADAGRLLSFDDSSNESAFMSRASLSTHEEEPEDDRSPTQSSSIRPEERSSFSPGQVTSSLEARHKSLVDLIQEDFPRTPSPIYNNKPSSSNHVLTEEAIESDILVEPLHDSSVTSAVQSSGTSTPGIHTVRSVAGSDITAAPWNKLGLPHSSSSTERIVNSRSGLKGESSSSDGRFDSEVFVADIVGSTISDVESEMKNFSISNEHINQPARQRSLQNNSHTRGAVSHVHGSQSQVYSQGIRHAHNVMESASHGHPKPPPLEVPVLQTSGVSPTLYGPTAYVNSGNPFLPNLQSSTLFAPQYNIGGYALNTSIMPPFITGYTPHGAFPVAFDNPSIPNLNVRTTGITTGGGATPGVDLQQLYKFYGQAIQPSFGDPLYMQYFQHPQLDAYSGRGQFDTVASRGPAMGNQLDRYNETKGSVHSPDQRTQYLRSGAISIPSPRMGGAASPNYYGSPQGMGVMMLYGTSPVGSPVMPESPAAATGLLVRRNDARMPANSSKNVGVYSGWQGQRGREKVDEPKPYSFLEELKSSKARRFELSDISGHIVEFSADQHGSRFIQQKLESCCAEEKAAVFEEVLPHASTLMTDVFGNYVIQKFFEHGSAEQRRQLANQLTGHILPLSLQMYGCRVIQKALEVIEIDQKIQLVQELDGHVMRCVRDQNGNHVIQKCIECVPTEKNGFIISAFRDQVATLSTHPYGCRVIQRVLEHCSDELQSQCIVNEILQSVCILAQDQYGNYVTQHVLERGKQRERAQIIRRLAGQIVQMSQNKYASNVIEKCLEYGDNSDKEVLIQEIIGQSEGNDNLLIMMKDQFANYVVQKILETCSERQRDILLRQIKIHLPALKKYTYGKHIVARVEQLSGEDGSEET